MNNIDCVYLAGLFDGEGSCSIQINIRSYKGKKSIHFNYRMTITLKDGADKVVGLLIKNFGGNVYKYRDGCKRWSIGKREDLYKTINMLVPHLRIKKDIALKFKEALDVMPEKRSVHRLGKRSWTKVMVLKVAEIALTLNPYRKSNKNLSYLKELESIYKTS